MFSCRLILYQQSENRHPRSLLLRCFSFSLVNEAYKFQIDWSKRFWSPFLNSFPMHAIGWSFLKLGSLSYRNQKRWRCWQPFGPSPETLTLTFSESELLQKASFIFLKRLNWVFSSNISVGTCKDKNKFQPIFQKPISTIT